MVLGFLLVFYGSISSKYKQIGNAVPVLLAKELGSYLFNLIQGNKSKGKEIAEQLSLFYLYKSVYFVATGKMPVPQVN